MGLVSGLMVHQVKFVHHDGFTGYRFSADHPLSPLRIQLTKELLEGMRVLEAGDIYQGSLAGDELLSLAHDLDYIRAVREAGGEGPHGDRASGNPGSFNLRDFGLGSEDNPVFPGMYTAARTIVGATVDAARLVWEGEARHALNLAGGMHHARRRAASGFCIFNDAAVTIAYLVKKYGARVAYIDTDAHHGDGVQWLFYDNPDVLTISFHESGRFLFPGTGGPEETGTGSGYGFSVNVPLEPYTDDDSWLEVFQLVVEPLLSEYEPDIIISQNGCDGHYLDPLTHLRATLRTYREIPVAVHTLAHEFCAGRWVAVGGGGYDVWRVVPRAWGWLWSTMSGRHLPRTLPEEWRERWAGESPVELPWLTEEEPPEKVARQEEIAAANRRVAGQVLDKALAVIRNRHYLGI